MEIFLGVLYLVVHLLILVVLARFVLEMVSSWSRNWRPRSFMLVFASAVYAVTDPILKPLRRMIPPLNMSGVSLDLSAIILIFGLSIVRVVLAQAFFG